MRRPHRTIETFDISLMAVVTKAMGAFLVLMLLLLPYYTPDSNEDDAAELLRQLKLLDAKLDEVHEQLGDPSKTVEELRGELEKITANTSLRAEVLAKLRGLINKAFSEIRRLEAQVADLEAQVASLKEENAKLAAQIEELRALIDPLKAEIARLEEENKKLLAQIEPLKAENEKLKKENAALQVENKKLEAEVAALLARIAKLEEELRRLKKNQPREHYRAVTASYDVRDCNDVTIKGVILRMGNEDGYTYDDDGTKIKPDFLLQVDLGLDGGAVPKQEPTPEMTGTNAQRRPLRNAGMLANMTIGQGDYVIVLIKQDPQRFYTVDGKPWKFLRRSGTACPASVYAAARAAFIDDWASNISVPWLDAAQSIAGIPLAFTSDEKGIHFRPPTKEEEEWLDKLVKLALKTQDDIPEIKKEREEAERKAREAEEKRRREAEERRKREEEDQKNTPTTTYLTLPQFENMRAMVDRHEMAPVGSPMRKQLEAFLPEALRRVNAQVEELEKQVETLPPGLKRERAQKYLSQLQEFLGKRGGSKPGSDSKKSGGSKTPGGAGLGQETQGDALTTSHISPRDLRQAESMVLTFQRAPKDSRMREVLAERLREAQRRVALQIEETGGQIKVLPPGPERARAEKYLSELRKFRFEE